MTTNSAGLFANAISANQLTQGLTRERNLPRDKDWLVQSDYAVGYSGSLASVPDLSQFKLDLSGIDAAWPFPQIVQCQKTSFIFTQSAIYRYEDGRAYILWYSPVQCMNRWTVSDFISFVIMSNSVDTLRYDENSDELVPVEPYSIATDEGTPHFAASVNYNGQLIIGGINNG